jgi:hypothetical protein
LLGHYPRDYEDIRVPRTTLKQNAKPLHVKSRRKRGNYFDVAVITGPRVNVEDPRRLFPAPIGEFFEHSETSSFAQASLSTLRNSPYIFAFRYLSFAHVCSTNAITMKKEYGSVIFDKETTISK